MDKKPGVISRYLLDRSWFLFCCQKIESSVFTIFYTDNALRLPLPSIQHSSHRHHMCRHLKGHSSCKWQAALHRHHPTPAASCRGSACADGQPLPAPDSPRPAAHGPRPNSAAPCQESPSPGLSPRLRPPGRRPACTVG